MALLQLGVMVTDARGSVGGAVFSRNTAGAIARKRVKPVNPRTPAQSLVRANFGANSKLWSGTMTADQRAAWTFFAQGNPMLNRLGASIILSGQAMQQKLNQVLSQIGSPVITDPPPDLSVPALAAVTGATSSASTANLQIDTDVQAVEAGAKYYVMATGSLAAGQKPQENDYRFVGAFAATAAASAIDASAEYDAVFGTPIVGSQIGVKVSTVNVNTGATTPALIFYATVNG